MQALKVKVTKVNSPFLHRFSFNVETGKTTENYLDNIKANLYSPLVFLKRPMQGVRKISFVFPLVRVFCLISIQAHLWKKNFLPVLYLHIDNNTCVDAEDLNALLEAIVTTSGQYGGFQAIRKSRNSTAAITWDFTGAFTFSVTIVTTIGNFPAPICPSSSWVLDFCLTFPSSFHSKFGHESTNRLDVLLSITPYM